MGTVRRQVKFLLPVLVLLGIFSGCASRSPVRVSFFAMDTLCAVTAYGTEASRAAELAEREMLRLDAMFSRMKETSPVSELNRRADGEATAVPEELFDLIGKATLFSERTNGAFDITVAPLMDLWNFKSESPRVPGRGEIEALLPLVGWKEIECDPSERTVRFRVAGMKIDLGGIAKGYASVRLAELMREAGVESALLSLGGNIAAIGKKPDGTPWQIGVQDPRNPQGILGTLSAADAYLITSGDYQRFFTADGTRYHHILDPQTGYPAQKGLVSATIISADGTAADAVSTALIVLGTDEAIRFWRESDDFEAVLVTSDSRVLLTEGLADQFTFLGEEAGYALTLIKR